MSFDPNTSPLLTPYNIASTPSYGLGATSNVIGQDQYNMTTIYTGAGGTLEIRPTGNLLSLSQVTSNGILAAGVGNTINTRRVLAGDASIAVINGDGAGDIGIAVQPNTTVQQIVPHVNGVQYGSPRSNINFIAGSGIGLYGSDVGAVSTITISASGGSISSDDYFVVTQDASDLPNSTNLGALTTGIILNTVVGGASTLSTAVPATAIANNNYQAGSFYLTQIANLTPSAGDFLYFAGSAWNVISGIPTLAANQTWTGTNIFDVNPKFPTGSTVGFVPTATDTAGTWTWQASGAGVTDAYYVVTQPDASLPNAINLGDITTGLVLNTSSSHISTLTTLPVSTFALAPLVATTTTTDASVVTLATIAIPSNQAVTLEGTMVARNSTFTDCTGGFFNATAINSSGVVTLIGTPVVAVNASSTASFNVSVSGTNMILSVSGIAATSYSWKATYSTTSL